MIIAFQSTRIRELCEDPDAADEVMGHTIAEVFRDRLADVRAAASVEDLIVGNPRPNGTDGQFLQISLGAEKSIVLEANHLKPIRDADGRVDWRSVSYVKVIEVAGL